MPYDRTRLKTKEFDRARNRSLGAGATLSFLDGNDLLIEITDGWRPRFSEFYGTTVFEIADRSLELASAVRAATHLVVRNSNDELLNNALHKKRDDYQPPLGDKPYWTIPAERKDELYTP